MALPLQSYEFEGKEDWFYEKIHYTFCRNVDPLQLTEYLVKQNCLTVTDLHEIRKMFRLEGRLFSATELLSRLRRRPYWVRNLLKACSQPELGLGDLRMYWDYLEDMHPVERKQVFKEEKPKLQLLCLSHEFESKEDWFYDRIRPIFCSTVDPIQLSEYLVEQNCLTDTDLDDIRKMFRWKGKLLVAAELLYRLRRQPNWIHYLLKACDHPELGLFDLKLYIIGIDSAGREWLFKEETLLLKGEREREYLFQWFEGREDWFYARIRRTFCSTVNPLQLSKYLFEQNCITVTDLQKIQEIFKLKGRLFAATELLSRLQGRPYWIHNIIKACSRPELGLNELKILIEVKLIRDIAERKVLFKGEKTEALSYLDVSWDDYVERGIKEEVRGNYDEISTESSDKLEQTDEQIALNREQLELGRLRPPVSFTHKMISPDLKDLFQSVESAFCVPEDTEQLSFAANLLKPVHSEKIASEIKLLSDRLEFLDCSKDFGKEDPGTVCALDVDIVFNKDHLGVVKRDPTQWNNTSLFKSERILKVILVHSRSLRVVETKLRVYKEYEMLFRSKTLHLQHEHEDFDEIAKKSANAKVSLFQRTIFYLVESIPSKNLAAIVSKAAKDSFIQSNIRNICDNDCIEDGGETVGTVNSNSYRCRLFSTVRRLKWTLVENTLRTICKSFGLEIFKEILRHIEYKMKPIYLFIYEERIQLNIGILDTLIEKITDETTSFLISICDPIFFSTGSFIGTFVFSVDVNSLIWRKKVADEIYIMISKYHKNIVEKTLILVRNICKKTTKDLNNIDKSLAKWKEKSECMDIIELVSIWEKREAMKNISGLCSHKSVLNLIAGIKNDKPTLKVFLSIDDQSAIGFIKDHPAILRETKVEFFVVKSYKKQKDQAKMKNYPIEKNVREMLSKTIKNQGERIHANHSGVVGLGIGNMDCNSQIVPCIIIYCLDKDLVPFGEKPLPKTLEGFRCDIREDFIMFGDCFDCHEIAHPNPGCCIGRLSNGGGSAGFLAKTYESGSETSGFLTAAHVAAENWTDLYNKNAFLSELEFGQYNREIVHPLLPNNNSGRIIGKVKESFCGNWGPEGIGIDAAFVQHYEQDNTAYRELQPADESELDYGDQLIVLKKGGTTGKTFGRLVDGSYSPCVNPRLDDIAWRLGGFYFFDRCFAVEDISGPFFNPGDSGSGVFLTENEHPTKPLGIAFAKLEYGQITVVCRIDQVARAFNLRLYEKVEPMEA